MTLSPPDAPARAEHGPHTLHRNGGSSTASFEALGVSHDLTEALTRAGIERPFPIQALAIPDALAGRDICGMAQTGSGKTLAFGLPMIERTTTARPRRPHSLVLAPTRELANQIAEELTPLAAARGLWLTAIYGGVSMPRQVRALQLGVDIVIATPGRLNDLLEQEELSLAAVSFVVVDEADQMADMGFLPQVERILKQIEGRPQTLLFSATLDGAVGALVRRYQQNPTRHEVASAAPTVDGLEQRFIGVRAEDKIDVTSKICAGARRALVFVRTTRAADRVAKRLGRTGLRVAAIHGRLSQNRRESTLEAFRRGDSPVLVATNVAARGLHVDGVDVVVHYDPPEDHKTYLHRSGRTARAGEDGMVVTLVLPEQRPDVAVLQRDGGSNYSVVEMRAGDRRLLDLASWSAPRERVAPDQGHGANGGNAGRRPGGRQSSKARNGRGRASGGDPRPAERRPARNRRR
ncbi:MAG: DEAD/DEAH box helicase [Chloroflexi bacterium]|nr:DEAD/DEAH box helicase [Chloroflexota bacterium]